MTVLAPNSEFVYRPMTVREPFAYRAAARYPLAPIVADIGAELVADKLGWVEPERQVVHTEARHADRVRRARARARRAASRPRYEHAVTIDDRRMDEALHGLIQDIEGGYLKSIAFVSPGRMAWPLPLYELALMTAGRAYDMEIELEATIVTPEESPLAIFGQTVSDGVAATARRRSISTITAAYAEIPKVGEIVVNPGDRRCSSARDRAAGAVRARGAAGSRSRTRLHPRGPLRAGARRRAGLRRGRRGRLPDQARRRRLPAADAVAESIAALAGADIEPKPFEPEIYGVLLTDERPRYIHAQLTGGHGFSSEFSETPIEGHADKIAARYLAPYLERLAGRGVAA